MSEIRPRVDTKPRSALARWVRDAADVAPLEYSLRKLKAEHAELSERVEADGPERERHARDLSELRSGIERLEKALRASQGEAAEAQQRLAATVDSATQRLVRAEQQDALAFERLDYHEGQIEQLRGLGKRLEWLEQYGEPLSRLPGLLKQVEKVEGRLGELAGREELQQLQSTIEALAQRMARAEQQGAQASQRQEYQDGQIEQLRGLAPRLEWLEQHGEPISQLRGWLQRVESFESRLGEFAGAQEQQQLTAAVQAIGQRIDRAEQQHALASERLLYQDGQIDQLRGLSPRLEWLEQHGESISQLRGYLQRVDQQNERLTKLAEELEAQKGELARLRDAGPALDAKPEQDQALRRPQQRRRPRGKEPRLAFLVHTLELLNHFGAVWDLLPAGSFEVVLHGEAAEGPRDAFARWGCAVRTSDQVLASGARYDFLVSNHPVVLDLLGRLADRQVRFMYAAGKSGWNLSDWNELYDVILCFGPFHAERFEAISTAVAVQMGYPRFDRFFQEAPDRSALLARYGCDPAKRTVVWLPTWKSLSSVGHYDAEISALMADWNVVVKLHPLMAKEEPERVDSLRRHRFSCLLAGTEDNLPLYQLADVMLFDYGGPPLAGIYTDKDMLLLNVPGANEDSLTGADSPDVAIRSKLASVSPNENGIRRLLADDALWDAQRPARRALRRQYFAPFFGFSADVAASALLRLPELVAQRS